MRAAAGCPPSLAACLARAVRQSRPAHMSTKTLNIENAGCDAHCTADHVYDTPRARSEDSSHVRALQRRQSSQSRTSRTRNAEPMSRDRNSKPRSGTHVCASHCRCLLSILSLTCKFTGPPVQGMPSLRCREASEELDEATGCDSCRPPGSQQQKFQKEGMPNAVAWIKRLVYAPE